ncbi:MAG: WD40 repeat domain-containing protein [Gemmatimonadota bacterium]
MPSGFDGHHARCVAWSADAEQVLSASKESLGLMDFATGQPVRKLTGHADGIYCAAFDLNGRQTLSGSRDRTVGSGPRELLRATGIHLLTADTLLHILKIRLDSRTQLEAVRRFPYVEYVKPGRIVDRNLKSWAESGCSMSPYSGPGGSTTTPEGDILPWNYLYMEFDKAWTKSNGAEHVANLVPVGFQ